MCSRVLSDIAKARPRLPMNSPATTTAMGAEMSQLVGQCKAAHGQRQRQQDLDVVVVHPPEHLIHGQARRESDQDTAAHLPEEQERDAVAQHTPIQAPGSASAKVTTENQNFSIDRITDAKFEKSTGLVTTQFA